MKLAISLFTVILIGNNAFAQDSLNTRKNEIGLDVTGFVRSLLPHLGEQSYYQYYYPTYYLSYRRMFKPGNLRLAIGGNAEYIEHPPWYPLDSNIWVSQSYSFDSRIGWEWKTKLSARWSTYYGIDFRMSYRRSENDNQYSNAGYYHGYKTETNVYGLAPLLGFQFMLNERISLRTEANLSFNIAEVNGRNTYEALPGYPEKADEVDPTTYQYYTSFGQPVSIFFVFNF